MEWQIQGYGVGMGNSFYKSSELIYYQRFNIQHREVGFCTENQVILDYLFKYLLSLRCEGCFGHIGQCSGYLCYDSIAISGDIWCKSEGICAGTKRKDHTPKAWFVHCESAMERQESQHGTCRQPFVLPFLCFHAYGPSVVRPDTGACFSDTKHVDQALPQV